MRRRGGATNETRRAHVHSPRFPREFVTRRYLFRLPLDRSSPLRRVSAIAVGSTNPVKVGAARAVLAPLAPAAAIDGVAVHSTVSDQPFGDDETIRGALARAEAARAAMNADLGVGIEGGVVEMHRALRTCAWAAIVDRDGRRGIGGSLAMPLPPDVARMIRDGMELGDAMDRLIGAHDTKRGAGAVGILTAGLVDRQRAYEVLVSYALAPFLTPEWYAAAASSR
jgi:inosine/xanthosine triphosphatase